jgi:hypothetical protein
LELLKLMPLIRLSWTLLEASRFCLASKSQYLKAASSRAGSKTTREGSHCVCETELPMTDKVVDEVYSKVEFSPVWMQLEDNGNYTVALKTYGTDDPATHTE